MPLQDPRPPDKGARDMALVLVLQQVWTYEVTTKGDFARTYADEFAEGSSRGYLTTAIIPQGRVFGRLWKLTPEGLAFLWANVGVLSQEEIDYAEAHCAR